MSLLFIPEDGNDTSLFEISQLFEEEMEVCSNSEIPAKMPRDLPEPEWWFLDCDKSKNDANNVLGRCDDEILRICDTEPFPNGHCIRQLSLATLTDLTVLEECLLMAKTSVLELKHSQGLTHTTHDMWAKREFVTNLLRLIRSLIADNHDVDQLSGHITFVHDLLGQDNFIPIGKVSSDGRHSRGDRHNGKYHYFHGYWEWRWLITLCHLQLMKSGRGGSVAAARFKRSILVLMYDLLVCSSKMFDADSFTRNKSRTPFACSCMIEMWSLMCDVTNFLSKSSVDVPPFEECFNEVCHLIFNPTELASKMAIVRNVNTNLKTASTVDLFLIWFIRHLPDYMLPEPNPLLRVSVHRLLEVGVPLNQLTAILHDLCVISERCQLDVELVVQLWDYFYKTINTNFSLASDPTSLSNILVANGSPISYVERVNGLLNSKQEQRHSQLPHAGETDWENANSFELFLILVAKLLRPTGDVNKKRVQQKLINRILLKFSSRMWLSMNEMGLHNLMSVFILIYATLNSSEELRIGERMENVLLAVPLNELATNRRFALIKCIMAVLILHLSRESKQGSRPFVVNLMKKIHLDLESNSQYGRLLMEVIDHLTMATSTWGDHGEHVLFDPWIVSYLKQCSTNDRENALNQINRILMKYLQQTSSGSATANETTCIKSMYTCLEPYLMNVLMAEVATVDVSEVVANFCLCLRENAESIFSQFVFCNTKNQAIQASICKRIATATTGNSYAISMPQLTWIRAWIKCMITTTDNAELSELTTYVVKLPDFADTCQCDYADFQCSNQPSTIWLSGMAKKYASIETNAGKELFAAKFEQYFKNYTKWTLYWIQSLEYAQKIYSLTTAMFFYCGEIMYHRQDNALFKGLIQDFYLTSSLLAGRQGQSSIVIRSISKIMHIFVESVYRLYSDRCSDPYLQKILTDFMLHWLPQLNGEMGANGAAAPLVRLMRNKRPNLNRFVLTDVCKSMLMAKAQRDVLILNVLADVFRQVQNEEHLMVTFLECTFGPTTDYYCNCDEFAPAKKFVLKLYESIAAAAMYRSAATVKKVIYDGLAQLTTTSMAYKSSVFFELMLKLATIFPSVVRHLINHIRNEMVEVEYRRGTGQDVRMRQKLANLEAMLVRQQNT